MALASSETTPTLTRFPGEREKVLQSLRLTLPAITERELIEVCMIGFSTLDIEAFVLKLQCSTPSIADLFVITCFKVFVYLCVQIMQVNMLKFEIKIMLVHHKILLFISNGGCSVQFIAMNFGYLNSLLDPFV